jgi:Tfp pilus assembly protein PilF
MYRSDRYTRNNNDNNYTTTDTAHGPLMFVLFTVVVVAIASACGTEGDETKTTTPSSSTTPSAISPPAVVARPTVLQPATFASAQALYAKHQYREASESFANYAENHPNNPVGHYMLGLSAWKSGDLDVARSAFERSLVLDSTNVKTLLNLGRVLLEQGKVDDAFVRVGAAIKLDSGSADAQRMMGRVQSARGEHDSAMMSYRVALSIDPTDSWSMNNLGLLLIGQGRYEEALSPLARAVALRPEAPAFANNLGVALERTGHPSAAADAFRAALKADSTYVKASRSLARVESKTDSTTVDVSALAAAFNDGIQAARQTHVVAKTAVKPESVKPPER